MRITVVGTGYVGLVTGACFAEMGNHVTCVDLDAAKLERLKQGQLPIYEPGLDTIVVQNHAAGQLEFTTQLAQAISNAEFIFIAVGTPKGEDGSADLSHVIAVAEEIGQSLDHYAVVINKSTVPVGTADKVRAAIDGELQKRGTNLDYDVVSNPEFLKEGAAVNDFMRPDRIIIGAESPRAIERMTELYRPYAFNHDKLMVMGVRDAELTKYAANAMLATKISFMNEMANLCDRMGVDVDNVRRGIGADQRIGYHFIYPGCGYGGSCFPKDVNALVQMGRAHNFEADILNAVESRNSQQKTVLFRKIEQHFDGQLEGKTFGIWGLAFKPGTDDMREASSTVLIKALLAAGAKVQTYDPVATNAARELYASEVIESGQLSFCDFQYDALKGADAMVLVTEWKRFRQPDFDAIKELLSEATIFDGRNQYSPDVMSEKEFTYYGIGRSNQPHQA